MEQLYGWFRVHKFDPPEVENNGLVVAPTGSGKSVLIAKLIRDCLEQFGGTRVLVLTHVKELIEQDYLKLMELYPECDAGIYSAGLNRRDTRHKVIFAGIQSVADKADALGEFPLVLIDEAHLIPHSGFGRYRGFLDDLRRVNGGKLRVVGYTATPYRLDSGLLHEGEGRLFTDIAAEIPLLPLIEQGYLSPLVAKQTAFTVDMAGVKKSGGEYVIGAAGAAMMADGHTDAAIEDALYRAHGRDHWLVFCCTIEHAETALHALLKRGVSAHLLTGQTPRKTRDAMLREFRAGQFRVLVNVGVLTTGFDYPGIDCIVMLRPTASTGLYIQMLGRGMRVADGKENCLTLDYAGNIERHGCVDDPNINMPRASKGDGEPVVKTCPGCETIVPARLLQCACGHEFPPPKPKITRQAANGALLSTQYEPVIARITRREESEYQKPGSEYPVTRVEYWDDDGIFPRKIATEWVCDYHPDGTWPKLKAEAWRKENRAPPVALKLDLRGKYPTILERIHAQANAA